jgi:hypothetical protein
MNKSEHVARRIATALNKTAETRGRSGRRHLDGGLPLDLRSIPLGPKDREIQR